MGPSVERVLSRVNNILLVVTVFLTFTITIITLLRRLFNFP